MDQLLGNKPGGGSGQSPSGSGDQSETNNLLRQLLDQMRHQQSLLRQRLQQQPGVVVSGERDLASNCEENRDLCDVYVSSLQPDAPLTSSEHPFAVLP